MVAPNRRRGYPVRAAAEDRSGPQTPRTAFGNPLCRQACPPGREPASREGSSPVPWAVPSFAVASPCSYHAAGGKRKMPGVRGQRPRSLPAVHPKVRRNRVDEKSVNNRSNTDRLHAYSRNHSPVRNSFGISSVQGSLKPMASSFSNQRSLLDSGSFAPQRGQKSMST